MDIEFDAKKGAANFTKHGVTFEEAISALFDPCAVCIEDPDAIDEHRWVLIGMNEAGRLITVVYTYRDEAIRIISARKSTRREAKQYA